MEQVQDPRGIARIAMALNVVFLLAASAKALADLNTIRVLDGFGGGIAPMPVLQGADAITGGTGLLYSVAFLVTGIAVLRWIYVTNRNAQAWSPHVEVTPGWNVGWFFVPVASWFKPFEGVRETYRASVDPETPATVPVPPVMRLWWGAWVLGGLLSYAVLWLAGQSVTPAQVIFTRWWQVGVAAVIVVQTLALVAVIQRTTAAQRLRVAG